MEIGGMMVHHVHFILNNMQCKKDGGLKLNG
jgi:hypothetical protein